MRDDSIRWPVLFISNEQMDELIKRESEKTPLRIIGHPAFRSPDGRLYPLPSENVVLSDDLTYFYIA